MKPIEQDAAAAALAWLDERAGDGFAGYDAPGWDAAAWIVNAMYETEALPGGMTYDEARRIEDAAGATKPLMVGETDLNEMLADATLTGGVWGARVGLAPAGNAFAGASWQRGSASTHMRLTFHRVIAHSR